MLIGELARKAGLPLSAIRFYERKGLLDGGHITRQENRYKDYGPKAQERLRFIGQAKSAGFTLAEIEHLLLGWDTLGTAERRTILEDKTTQIERRMAEMEQMRTYLAAKVAALPPE